MPVAISEGRSFIYKIVIICKITIFNSTWAKLCLSITLGLNVGLHPTQIMLSLASSKMKWKLAKPVKCFTRQKVCMDVNTFCLWVRERNDPSVWISKYVISPAWQIMLTTKGWPEMYWQRRCGFSSFIFFPGPVVKNLSSSLISVGTNCTSSIFAPSLRLDSCAGITKRSEK